ncbi:EnvZ/OmpR regulon moderator MzrA [Erwiniaceae bacterium CAU 1747]
MPSLFKLPTRILRAVPRLGLLTASLLTFALVVALLPALFRSEAALQIRTLRQGNSLPDGFYIYQSLSAQGIRIKSITPDHDSLVIRFDSQEQSYAAEKVLRELLPFGFNIARQEDHGAVKWVNRISLRT